MFVIAFPVFLAPFLLFCFFFALLFVMIHTETQANRGKMVSGVGGRGNMVELDCVVDWALKKAAAKKECDMKWNGRLLKSTFVNFSLAINQHLCTRLGNIFARRCVDDLIVEVFIINAFRL